MFSCGDHSAKGTKIAYWPLRGSLEMECELTFSSRDKAMILYYPNTSVAISKQNKSLQIKWKIWNRNVYQAGF